MRLVVEVPKRLIVLLVHLKTARQWAKTTLQGGEMLIKCLVSLLYPQVFAVMCQQLLKPLIRLVFCLDGVRSQEQNKWHRKSVQDICQLAELIMSQSLFHK